MRNHLVILGFCLIFSACSEEHGDDKLGGDNLEREVREALTQRVQSDVADDIGVKITEDQPIAHEFRVRNPTAEPIRILNAQALKTCCSSIGPIPREIPAHGEAMVPVVWKAGHQSDRKRVQFVLMTDRADCRTIDLSLTANLLPAWEVSLPVVKSDPNSSRAGAVQTFRIITRTLGPEGRSFPTSIETTGPFRAKFVGEPTKAKGPGEAIETRRDAEVELTTTEIGSYSGELRLVWSDGTTKTHPISRQVLPQIRSTPSTLVVSESSGTHAAKVIVQSDGQPFRILSVTGSSLAQPVVPGIDPLTTHILDLELDCTRLDRSGTSDIEVLTDHPKQKSIKIKVFLVASQKENVR